MNTTPNIKQYKNKTNLSIVCLIYKSIKWLQFVYTQLQRYTNLVDVEFYFVANDATIEVIEYLQKENIPHYIHNNSELEKQEWYINNVYRAWNKGAELAKGNYILFINSDMGFSPNWLINLEKATNINNCVCSRLVESGKMLSGQYGISMNFGKTILEYKENDFIEYSKNIEENVLKDGGLYMPLLIRKSDFINVGGYPPGNILPGTNIYNPIIATQGQPCIPGDYILMQKLASKGIRHQTVFDSIVYHFQEGEMDE
jgi:glycosyltransferase involved in cell wall biosynthesis